MLYPAHSGTDVVVALESNHCPPDPEETAEAYCMGRLSDKADATAFEEHCFVCPRCLAVAEATKRYVRNMQIAARRLRNENRDLGQTGRR